MFNRHEEGSYSKLSAMAKYFRMQQEKELDVFTIITGAKGFGKSSTAIQLARKYYEKYGVHCKNCKTKYVWPNDLKGKELWGNGAVTCVKCNSKNTSQMDIDFDICLAYDNKDMFDLIYNSSKYSLIIADEAVRFMMGSDWNKKENKQLKKVFAQMRTKGLLIFGNVPAFKWIDSKYRNEMCHFWIRILKRGMVLLFNPDLSEVDDPWHLDDLKKVFTPYFYFSDDVTIDRLRNKIRSKYPCYFDNFKVPIVPKDIYLKYKEHRDKKAFERQEEEQAEIRADPFTHTLYNLYNNFDRILEEYQKIPKGKLTYKFIAENIVVDKQKKPIYTFQQICNLITSVNK